MELAQQRPERSIARVAGQWRCLHMSNSQSPCTVSIDRISATTKHDMSLCAIFSSLSSRKREFQACFLSCLGAANARAFLAAHRTSEHPLLLLGCHVGCSIFQTSRTRLRREKEDRRSTLIQRGFAKYEAKLVAKRMSEGEREERGDVFRVAGGVAGKLRDAQSVGERGGNSCSVFRETTFQSRFSWQFQKKQALCSELTEPF